MSLLETHNRRVPRGLSYGRMSVIFAAGALSTVLAGCGSSGGGTVGLASHEITPTVPTSSKTKTSQPAPKAIAPFFKKSGSGDVSGVQVSQTGSINFRLSWQFNCGATKKPFKVSYTSGGKLSVLSTQMGLGGGGHRTFSPGAITVAVSTSCQWKLTATSL
jgi:hypothetical protein